MKMGKHYLRIALQSQNMSCLKSIHLYLNQLYYLLMYGDESTHFITDANVKKLKVVEKEWMGYEEYQCRKKHTFSKKIFTVAEVEAELKQHAVYQHSLLAHLEKNATKEDLSWFLLNESVLNFEFFDYLVLSLMGVPDLLRAEIMHNCWRECGPSNIAHSRSKLFRRLLNDLNLNYNRDLIVANMSWQILASINLFSYFGLRSYNKMKLYGAIVANELLYPKQSEHLIRGVKRAFKETNLSFQYYADSREEHQYAQSAQKNITLQSQLNKKSYQMLKQRDVFKAKEAGLNASFNTQFERPERRVSHISYASSWLQGVVLPELEASPHKLQDFWWGFYMRLDSVLNYYTYFQEVMLADAAA